MGAKLAAEIRQKNPFALLEEEALLNLACTHEVLQQRQSEFFKRFQLTPTQYGILRILRDAGRGGMTCSHAAGRMVAADPDVTRLLDRLEARKLIRRARSRKDRRVVIARIAPRGLELMKAIDQPLAEFHKRQLGGIGREQLARLIEILGSIRGG